MDRNFEKAFYDKLNQKKIRVVMSVTSSILRSILVLLPTLLMRYIYNSIELGLDARGTVGIILLTFAIPVVVGASYSLDIRLSKYIYVIIKEIRVQALSNIVHTKLRSILKQNKGNLYNRLIVSLEELGDYYYNFINTTTWYITTSAVGILLMLLINFRITLVLLLFSGLQIGCSLLIQKRIEKTKAAEKQLQTDGTNFIVRIMTHNKFIKTALLDTQESGYMVDWKQSSWNICKANIINKQITALLSFLLTLMRTLYLFFAVHYLLLSNSMLRGDFIALNSYIIWLTPVFEGLQECVEDIIKSRENKRRVNAYLTEDKKTEHDTCIIPNMSPYSIEVKHLSFSFENSLKPVLHNLSFKLQEKETCYIVGASGCGKSTLLNIMLGLEPTYDGKILYNDYDLRQIDDHWLHQNVIIVGQDVDILPTTLRNNLFYSGMAATDDDAIHILHALKIGYLLDMPGGLDWDMKQYPRTLSDGEKKRLAIARAILSKPQVLFLDEPTAGLDNINKMEVIQFIENRIDGILLIVTHDRIFPEHARIIHI